MWRGIKNIQALVESPGWGFVDPCLTLAMGHTVLPINGLDLNGKCTADRKQVLEYLGSPTSYLLSNGLGQPHLPSNEKLILASVFHLLFEKQLPAISQTGQLRH